MWKVKFDIFPDPEQNEVTVHRNNLRIVNTEEEVILSQINDDAMEDNVNELLSTNKKKSNMSSEQNMDTFILQGAEIIKSAKSYSHIEIIDGMQYKIEWDILGANEQIEEDDFAFPTRVDINFDGVDLSDPGT
jgi:hypothetical protein